MKKSDREIVRLKYDNKCAYCGCELQKGWHVDHLEALRRISDYDKEKKKFVFTGDAHCPENNNMDNYMPSCASCNITKSTLSLQDFREYIEQTVESLNHNRYAAYKFAKRYGLLQETVKPVLFHFETYNTMTQSRCCGRCDGVNDICVSDMICEAHNVTGCEDCYGKR